ncbi:MAG: single-stranded-DNA-specific exonuclease RecJ [Parcubacteria group bacterium]
MLKQWKIKDKAPLEFFEQFKNYHPIAAQLLYNRGLKNESDALKFFNPDYNQLHDPFLFKDMAKAVERILSAIENKEKIIVHGDYDADGVTSAAVLFKILKALGADVEVFIPHREWDGYGLNLENAQNFVDCGFKLLITVDCGITNVKEIEFLNKFGVDVIVTDHHEPLEILPEAVAILDPKTKDSGYPFRDLAGVGIAFKLACALIENEKTLRQAQGKLEKLKNGKTNYDGLLKWMLDIVAIGTVADVAPLMDENRILVKWGLVVLQKTQNLGLQKLIKKISTKKIDSFTIGFQLAPRLNAAGRMNHANAAFKLLISEDEEEASQLADDLQKNNQDRQRITEAAVDKAKEFIAQMEIDQKILFAFHEEWEPGIIGLIAGKLCDEFYRPVIVMTKSKERVVGSGRSVPGFNITQGLTTVSAMLSRFGGHSQACGFTLTDINVKENFQNELAAHAKSVLADVELTPSLDIDAEIKIKDISWDLLNQLELFAPYGEGNLRPRFLISGLDIAALDKVGGDGQHLRLSVKQDLPRVYKMMGFSLAKKNLPSQSSGKAGGFKPGEKIDAVCEVGINEWNGNREFEFKIVDLKYSNHE